MTRAPPALPEAAAVIRRPACRANFGGSRSTRSCNGATLSRHRPEHLGQDVEGQLHTKRKHQGNEDAGTHVEGKPAFVGGQPGDVKEGLDDVPADEVIAERELRRVAQPAVLREGMV